jgi:hypothetical protein
MEVFGLALNELIFYIFLPFLFFYLLLYGLLRKTKILGEPKEANTLNTFLALVISALGIFSLYSLGLSSVLPFFAGFTAVAAFVILYLSGMFGKVKEKVPSYVSGEAFKTEDEKKFEAGVKNCEGIWERHKTETKPKAKEQALKEMVTEVSKLEPIASKLNKSLYDFDWYKEYKTLLGEIQG